MKAPSIQRTFAPPGSTTRVLLTVSGVIPDDVDDQVDAGLRPRPDYLALAEALQAEILDVGEARRRSGRVGRAIERLCGQHALLAWTCYRSSGRHDVVFTDGEQVGLPLALLWSLRLGRRRCAHVMIGHYLSTWTKHRLYRWFRLGPHIDRILVYSTWQQRFVTDTLGHRADQVILTPFMVDTEFFTLDRVTAADEPMICAAGLEWRDYPTLLEAVRGLDVRVVIAPASPWSRWSDSSQTVAVPDNVEIRQLGFADLRQLYADADLVVMPLLDAVFQAGVTTLLEAMAMERAIICSQSRGQTDVVVHEENGVYVPPGDVAALRAAILALLADPARAREMGRYGRKFVEEHCEVSVYSRRLAQYVLDAVASRP
jgi:glycosyltransferase involved in cell wall biosynthesis